MLIPRIKRVSEIPQWIISSDRAAYCPQDQTIWIREDQNFLVMGHEIGHHVIHLLGGGDKIQTFYDKIYYRLCSIAPSRPDWLTQKGEKK